LGDNSNCIIIDRYLLFVIQISYQIPQSILEQTAIATVISNMDTEIEKLENKLKKYRQIKTGMMQQLLTGKIRLLDK
jgi:type I restriction enzyme, S subunit